MKTFEQWAQEKHIEFALWTLSQKHAECEASTLITERVFELALQSSLKNVANIVAQMRNAQLELVAYPSKPDSE
jgi:hypothetical protein